MALSDNLSTYSDVRAVADAALAAGGARFTATTLREGLPTRGAAIHWVQRFNKFKALLRDERLRHFPREDPVTPYDDLRAVTGCTCNMNYYNTRCNRGSEPGCRGAEVMLVLAAPTPELYSLDGRRLDVSTPTRPRAEPDPLESEADRIRREVLGLEDDD